MAVDEQAKAPSVSPDSRFLYYFADESGSEKPRIIFKRLSLETFRVEVVTVFDKPVDGIGRRPRGGMGGGASMRADGKMILGGFNFVGDDGENHFSPVLVNPETGAIRGFEWEPYSWRVGGTYFPGTDPAHLKHIFMCRCHRSQHWDEKGTYSEKWYSDVRSARSTSWTRRARSWRRSRSAARAKAWIIRTGAARTTSSSPIRATLSPRRIGGE